MESYRRKLYRKLWYQKKKAEKYGQFAFAKRIDYKMDKYRLANKRNKAYKRYIVLKRRKYVRGLVKNGVYRRYSAWYRHTYPEKAKASQHRYYKRFRANPSAYHNRVMKKRLASRKYVRR